MCSWGKFWTTRHKKTKKPNCHFWRSGCKNTVSWAKAGSCPCPLHSTPPKGWANLPKPPLWPDHWTHPTVIPHSIGTSYLFSLPLVTISSVQFSRSVVSDSFSTVQSLSRVRLFVTAWIAARQASLSITNSWSSLWLTSIKSVMPSSHLIFCHPLLLLPSIFSSIRVFSNESVLHIRWPKVLEFQLQHQSF